MNRTAILLLATLVLAACPGGGGDEPTNRLWLDAREGADPALSPDMPPRF